MNNKYLNVTLTSDPKVIGVRNGVYQVELKVQESFLNKKEQKKFDDYFDQSADNFLAEKYKPMVELPTGSLKFTPLKSAKETDFVSFVPALTSVFCLFSFRAFDILGKYKLPEHFKIKSEIIGFKNQYYLVSIPMISNNSIDFIRSSFCNQTDNTISKLKDKNDYLQKTILRDDYRSHKLFLKENIDVDVFCMQGEVGLFFKEKLLEEIEKQKFTGLKKKEVIVY